MLIGIVGAPNKGKSTLFASITSNDVAIADYPFTTIDPNKGVGYVTHPCPETELHIKCIARNSLCVDGVRKIPVNIIDVAGLVENAHLGKGMGNQFLNDLAAADCFIIVVDASGKTDSIGNPSENSELFSDYNMIVNELVEWISDILKKHMRALSRASNGVDALLDILTSLKIKRSYIEDAIEKCDLTSSMINWDDKQVNSFSKTLIKISKPIAVVANKMDAIDSKKRVESLKEKIPDVPIFECSAAIELALIKATKKGYIDYIPGANSFDIPDNVESDKLNALKYMQKFIFERNGTGVQSMLNALVFEMMKKIVVYPVEDDSKYTDHFGNVLPDAILVDNTSTAVDLARIIHTELADRMLYAIDARKKMRIAKEQILSDNQIVRIVSSAKQR